MKILKEPKLSVLFFLILGLLAGACKKEKKGIKVDDLRGLNDKKNQSAFQRLKIANGDSFNWSKKMADVTGDELVDLLFYKDNGSERIIGYCTARREDKLWEITIISKAPLLNDSERLDYLITADVDGDHDNDIIGFKKTKATVLKQSNTELFWYENMGNDKWKYHSSKLDLNWPIQDIGEVNFADFNNDEKIDFSVLTENSDLFIFKQIDAEQWKQVQQVSNKQLHPNVSVGDVNGDTFVDIVSSGFIYYNPGADLSKKWQSEQLNQKWNNYEEGIKSSAQTVLHDVDFDGKVEIYMTPNHASGYPLIAYKAISGSWQYRTIKDSMEANSQLQVVDFDRDMDFDIITTSSGFDSLSSTNQKRVTLIENDRSYINYEESILDSTYVGEIQMLDYDLDGDLDVFLYPNKNSPDFSVLVNTKIWNGSF